MLRLGSASISPRFFLEARDLSDFTSEFGPLSGRYVATRVAQWMDTFQDQLRQLADVERVRAVELAKNVKLALLPEPTIRGINPDAPWVEEALELKGKRQVDVVVGDALDPTPFQSWVDTLDAIRSIPRGGWRFRGSIGDYLKLIEPFLLNAPALYLVDPFFDVLGRGVDLNGKQRPNGGQDRFVAQILERAASTDGSRCYELHVIVDARKAYNGMSVEKFEEEVNARFSPHIKRSRSLHLHLVTGGPRTGQLLRLHNRYFLSLIGGLSFSESIEIVERGRAQSEAHVLSGSALPTLLATYADGVARFHDGLRRFSKIPYPRDVSSIVVR